MSLSYNKSNSGFKIEHVVIIVLVVALITALAYFVLLKDDPIAPVAAPAPVAAIAEPTIAEPIPAASAEQAQPTRSGMAVGKYQGELHPIVDILDNLKGFKYDDSVAAADTVYIVYDPRCPYCEVLFDQVSEVDLAAKQITIKWLPSLALGDDNGDVQKQAALSLRVKTVDEFGASFRSSVDVSGVTITQEDKDAMNENMAFLFEASNQTFGEDHPKSVPAVFFIDKETGSPNMMYGASDAAVFKQIFGE